MKYSIGNVRVTNYGVDINELYSDGAIEYEFLNWVQQENFNEEEILEADNRWPVLYYFSKNRWNLLDWYPFERHSKILEVGAGCGALTGLLCEKVDHVYALEMSELRSKILAYRHKTRKNLKVMIADINNYQSDELFDYVTLIGILEYAGKFSINRNEFNFNPYQTLLENVRKTLRPNGKLLIAIENKFGLKYWSGAKEDHTGNLHENIEGYRMNRGIKTFSLKELKSLLFSSGFKNLKIYYPYPDYKLPEVVFSDDHLPSIGQLNSYYNYERDRYVFFNEKNVINELIKDNQFPMFSNSFLIEATN
ncbi:MAG: class I SAM-dependent methyltransferase [Bacillaceae bacterium]|nr:class I SAM-dependent methyltransferase [Bacillaceae bacterium]